MLKKNSTYDNNPAEMPRFLLWYYLKAELTSSGQSKKRTPITLTFPVIILFQPSKLSLLRGNPSIRNLFFGLSLIAWANNTKIFNMKTNNTFKRNKQSLCTQLHFKILFCKLSFPLLFFPLFFSLYLHKRTITFFTNVTLQDTKMFPRILSMTLYDFVSLCSEIKWEKKFNSFDIF